MAPRSKPDIDNDNPGPDVDGPTIEQQDWDAVKGGRILPDSVPENGDLGYGVEVEKDGDLPEEDDDNA